MCGTLGAFATATVAAFAATTITVGWSFTAAHLGALFFQDRFARQADAVAFD